MGASPLKDLSYIKTPTDRPFRVSIEGNIGAGKSSLIEYFNTFPGIETYPEPIEWWRNLNGHNLLDLLYKDIHKWHATFQIYVQLTRLKIQTSIPKSGTNVQMFERSLQNNRFCFVEHAYTYGYLEEPDFMVMDKWYKFIRKNVDIDLDLIVYLRSTPEVVYERTLARGRPEETGISLQYLKELHNSHERWLMDPDMGLNNIPVVILDADKTRDEILQQYKINEHKIMGHDKKNRHVAKQADKDKVKKTLL